MEGAERRMACRSAAARGMTCEGAAARGTKHARWRSGRGGLRDATEHARWQNFTILYARADKTRLFGKIRLFCTLGQGFRLVFSTLEANLAKSSVPTVHFSVISPESPTFRAQAYKKARFCPPEWQARAFQPWGHPNPPCHPPGLPPRNAAFPR